MSFAEKMDVFSSGTTVCDYVKLGNPSYVYIANTRNPRAFMALTHTLDHFSAEHSQFYYCNTHTHAHLKGHNSTTSATLL